MAHQTCTVDIEPKLLGGLTCGRLFRDGECPVHRETTTPSVFEHSDPDADRIIREYEASDGERHPA